MSRPNLRGKGKKDERLEALEKLLLEQQFEIERLKSKGGEQDAGDAPFTANPGKVRRRQVRARAYDLYVGLSGDVLDLQLRNAGHKARAFAAQIKGAEVSAPEGAWGPTITPYEDRMSGSLVARLIKEKNRLLEFCIKEARMDADESEELGEEFVEYPSAENPPEPDAPRLTFSEEEKRELLDWIEDGSKSPAPAISSEFDKAAFWVFADHRRMTPEIMEMLLAIEGISARRKREEEEKEEEKEKANAKEES
ncbi:MAG: hypothetical protein K8I27_13250 [Planctomycetes bacterium]|nr:hypothetical protein [Planctomycetota bacterium]